MSPNFSDDTQTWKWVPGIKFTEPLTVGMYIQTYAGDEGQVSVYNPDQDQIVVKFKTWETTLTRRGFNATCLVGQRRDSNDQE